ncbi:MAG: ABC transporter ATP-binding protein [Hyphomicrobiaceae bacterium]|nr:ABC transporter ATP-binding protein [Hyphomicrobiaceae bacterium]
MAAQRKTTTKRKPAAKRKPARKASAKTTPKPRTKTTAKAESKSATESRLRGYGGGGVDTVISVEDVTRQIEAIAQEVTVEELDALVDGEPFLTIDDLRAGYGKMEILHNLNLRVGRKQSLCLIGPNGAGKSTILHAIFGFNNIFGGQIRVGTNDAKREITNLSPNQKLKQAGIAYILQDKSVFPSMTVEENLWMGGFLMDKPAQAKEAAERVFDKYPRLAARRKHQAKVLSGGERRLLEISRALVMEPEVLLVDEPSIGLEPRFIDMVFEILHDLQHNEGKTILMVEQNAKKGLEFADIGYVLVSGEVAIAGKGDKLLKNPEVGRLFLGG